MRSEISLEKLNIALSKTPYRDYKISNVTSGVSTNVFKLTNNSTKNLFLKIFPEKGIVKAIYLLQNQLLDKGIKVPKVVYINKHSKILDGSSYLIEEAIEGIDIKSDILEDKNILKNIMIEAGEDLAKINSVIVKGIGPINKGFNKSFRARYSSYSDFAINGLEPMIKELNKTGVLSKELGRNITRYIDLNKNIFNIKGISFLAHGDFDTEHIYHKNGVYSGIIDFGDIRGTTKFHDLSHFYTNDMDNFNDLLLGYRKVFDLPKDYLERVKAEAVLFGVRRLWWISKNLPKKLKDNKILKFLEKGIIFSF